MSPTVYDLLRGALFWIMFYFVSKFIREWWYNTVKPKPNHMSKKKKISGEKDKGNDSNAFMKMIEKQQDGGIDIKATGNKTEHYSWIQTSEDVEVKIPLEPLFDEVTKHDIQISIQYNFLKVIIKDKTIMNDFTYDALDTEECTWTVESLKDDDDDDVNKSNTSMEKKYLFLYLRKKYETKGKDNWNCVLKHEKNKIDNSYLGAPVSILDPNDPDSMKNIVQSLRRRG